MKILKAISIILKTLLVILAVVLTIRLVIISYYPDQKQTQPNNPVNFVQQIDDSNTILVEMQDGTEYICFDEDTRCVLVEER